ncbi:MAG: LLM class flavin-dependent oxidoreductase [Anaerolineae bacterium]|nr:LLM class flavin-dependent oxidoreductase [Anaerolineae bacterium]
MTIQFGLLLPTGSRPGQPTNFIQPLRQHAAEFSTHFHSLWMTDHFFWGDTPTYEAWTTITYLAATLPEFHIGSLVLGQGYRNPALLAKMAATLQLLSGGRLILGLGAGWKEDEYHAYGYDFPPASERITELEEALIIIKRMWYDENPVDYYGRHYRIVDAYCEPQPNPIPPLLVGGGGRKTLRVTAQHANWWNYSGKTPQLYREKVKQLHESCDYIGRNPRDIRLTWLGKLVLGNTPAAIKKADPSGDAPLSGNAAQVVDRIGQYVELGVDYFIFELPNLDDLDMLHRVAEEVLPQVQALKKTKKAAR